MAEPRIWILPQEVAERIAAGEVVERPASVVKELVENALDAGARRVTVEIEAGGKSLIRVTDDGGGMTSDEARLALFRHATSKIRTAEDLFDIHTLGFRGEALPSIAAVSELEIVTRTEDETEGTRLQVRGGIVENQEPTAAQVGSIFTVRRLFFNLPVREKFLRGDATEAGQITEWIQRLAMARSDVSFRLLQDGREAFLSAGSQDLLNAAVAVLGRQVARELLRIPVPPMNECDSGSQSIRVTGFVGRPTLTRANRSLQHFYVNGRAVRSALFNRALKDAFRATMPAGRHPVAVLFVEVPPGSVDVNVHPAKTEVRFPDEGSVVSAVVQAIQITLRADNTQQPLLLDPKPDTSGLASRVNDGAANLQVPSPSNAELPFAGNAIGGPTPQERFAERARRKMATSFSASGEVDPFTDLPDTRLLSKRAEAPPAGRRETFPWGPGDEPTAVPHTKPHDLRQSDAGTAGEWLRSAGNPGGFAISVSEPAIPELTLLGQSQNLFILAEGGGKLWVIDQHVAHERVLYDRLTAPGSAGEPGEPLLIPVSITVDKPHSLALGGHLELLAELGFEVEPFGSAQYLLRAVPRSLLGRNYEAVFRDLADELTERTDGGEIRLRKEELAVVAAGRSCKSAVKAGQSLDRREVEQLLEELRQARNPHTCPHGRPVFLTYDQNELATLFGGTSCE